MIRRLLALTTGLIFASLIGSQVAGVPTPSNLARRQSSSSSLQRLGSKFVPPAIAQDTASTSPQVTAFNQVTVDADHRTLNTTAKFPDARQSSGKVTMRLKLECPDTNDPKKPSDWTKCDWWDRAGYVAIVKPDKTKIELMRFMTPYGLPGEWDLDVTSLQPLLRGNVQFELFIDTWVKSGHENGNGWLATVSFDFEGNPPPGQPVPVEVIPLWNEQKLVVGDPNSKNSIDKLIKPVEVSIPADASRVELRSLITGHGQGNTNNCAEWCNLKHIYSVAGKPFDPFAPNSIIGDCSQAPFGVNPTDLKAHKQQRETNWNENRAGWCPGDIVRPSILNVTEAAKPSTSVQVNYEIEKYINTLSSGYDEGNHTEPFYRTSAVLVIYK